MSTIDYTKINVPNTADYLELMRAEFEQRTETSPDWGQDLLISMFLSITADRLAAASELLYTVIDQKTTRASGPDLDDVLALNGIPLISPTPSTVEISLTGTPDRTVPARELFVRGGGIEDKAEWQNTTDIYIGLDGTGSGLFECTEVGATVASVGDIDTIVTPLTYIDSVTNNKVASVGSAVETDPEKRQRLSLSRGSQSRGCSAIKIRGRLLSLSFLDAAIINENTSSVPQLVNGIMMDPLSILTIVYPANLTPDQSLDVIRVLAEGVAASTPIMEGDVTADVVTGDGVIKTVSFAYADEKNVNVSMTVYPKPGVLYEAIKPLVESAISTYINGNDAPPVGEPQTGLSVGEPLRSFKLNDYLADSVDGLDFVSDVLFNGTPSDIVPSFAEKIVMQNTPILTEGTA